MTRSEKLKIGRVEINVFNAIQDFLRYNDLSLNTTDEFERQDYIEQMELAADNHRMWAAILERLYAA